MKFITYLKNEFKTRLEESGVLVVFDPDRRYEDVFDKLESVDCELVKGTLNNSGQSGSGKTALEMSCLNPEKKHPAIYVPRQIPESEEDKQMEPFAHFSDMGKHSPKVTRFLSFPLQKAKAYMPHRLIVCCRWQGADFETVDAVDGSGSSWPRLRKLLKGKYQDVVFKFCLLKRICR